MLERDHPWLKGVLAACTVFFVLFIFSRSLYSGEESGGQSKAALAAIQFLLGRLGMHPDLSELFIRKAAHFSEYAALGILLCATVRAYSPRPWRHLFFQLFTVLAVAVSDEFLQTFIPGRNGAVTDVAIDFSGALTGLLLCLLVVRFRFPPKEAPRVLRRI